MREVIVGVVLTAVLVPVVKGVIDRRSERFGASVALVDILAVGLWTYWKFAMRVAYYGRQGERSISEFDHALQNWDSGESWLIGRDIQDQVSRSKRLLPPDAQQALDRAQQSVVDFLDREVDRLRQGGTQEDWERLYNSLMGDKRDEIDSILAEVTTQLRLSRRPRWSRGLR